MVLAMYASKRTTKAKAIAVPNRLRVEGFSQQTLEGRLKMVHLLECALLSPLEAPTSLKLPGWSPVARGPSGGCWPDGTSGGNTTLCKGCVQLQAMEETLAITDNT